MTVMGGPALTPPMATYAESRQIRFDHADGAYLAMAAIRRYLDATVVSDVFLVPTDHGPALELPASAVSLSLIKTVVRRFGGHIGKAGPDILPDTRTMISWSSEPPRGR